MEELVFFAVIIVFAILDSIARSRKAKQGGGEAEESPEVPGGRTWEPDTRGSPSYDGEPSYDDVAVREVEDDRQRRTGHTPDRYTAPSGSSPSRTAPGKGAGAGPSSETMLPGDLLEQLERLARGGDAEKGAERRREQARGRVPERGEERARDLPDRPPSLPPLERTEVGTGKTIRSSVPARRPSAPARVEPEHRVHLSHAEYGTDPSSRSPSLEGRIDPLAEPLGADAAAVRRQLRSGRGSALRQAIILRDVIGPPLALRDDPIED